MPVARPTINGGNTPKLDANVGDSLTLGNDNQGGELTILQTLLDQPEGAADSIVNPTSFTATLQVKKEGGYRGRTDINGGDALLGGAGGGLSAFWEIGVVHAETGEVVPPLDMDKSTYNAEGWARLQQRLDQRISDDSADPGRMHAQAAEAHVRGDVVRVSVDVLLLSGYPGQRNRPVVTKALATRKSFVDKMLYVCESASVAPGAVGRYRFLGMYSTTLAGSPAVGDPVFVSDAGALSLTPGTVIREVARVTSTAAGPTYKILFDGGSQWKDFVDVQDFGATPIAAGSIGPSTPDSRVAFQLAVTYAQARKRRVYFNGRYMCKTASATNIVVGTGVEGDDVEIFGDGPAASEIVIGGTGADPSVLTDYCVLFLCAQGSFVRFRDFSITGLDHDTFRQYAIYHNDGALRGEVRVRSVNISLVNAAIFGEGGPVFFEIQDSSLQVRGDAVFFLGWGSGGGKLYMRNCDLLNKNAPFTGLPESNRHLVYIDNGVPYQVLDTRFNGTTPSGVQMHIFGGGGIQPAGVTLLKGCVFSGPCTYAILGNTASRTVVDACFFDGGDSQVAVRDGGMLITGCVFVGGTDAWVALTDYSIGKRVTNGGKTYRCIEDGTSAASGGPSGTGTDILDGTVRWTWIADDAGESVAAIVPYINASSSSRVSVVNCEFSGKYETAVLFRSLDQTRAFDWTVIKGRFKHTRGSCVANGSGVTDHHTIFETCDFVGAHAEETLFLTSGRCVVRDCTWSSQVANINPTDGNIELVFDRNRFSNVDALRVTTHASNSTEIFGSDNDWTVGNGPFVSGATLASVKGHLRLRKKQGADVSSGATITLAAGADTFHITGTTTVQTIAFAASGSNGSWLFAGPLVLIADGAWAFSEAGNIVADHTGVRDAGERIMLVREPLLDKWAVVSRVPRLTAGSIPFAGTGGRLSQDNSDLFWDAGNDRLGVGRNNPATTLDVDSGDARAVVVRTDETTSLITFFDSSSGGSTLGTHGVDIGANGLHGQIMTLESGGEVLLGTEGSFRVRLDTATFFPQTHDAISLGTDSWAPGGGSPRRFKDGLFSGDVRVGDELEIDGPLNHDGTTVGFYGVVPVTRSAGWTITNDTADRTFDANATDINEIADVVATLIRDLAATGIIGAVA